MTRSELSEKFWDASNAITGFACVQAVAFSLLLLSKDATEVLCRRVLPISWISSALIALIIALILNIFYALGACMTATRGLE